MPAQRGRRRLAANPTAQFWLAGQFFRHCRPRVRGKVLAEKTHSRRRHPCLWQFLRSSRGPAHGAQAKSTGQRCATRHLHGDGRFSAHPPKTRESLPRHLRADRVGTGCRPCCTGLLDAPTTCSCRASSKTSLFGRAPRGSRLDGRPFHPSKSALRPCIRGPRGNLAIGRAAHWPCPTATLGTAPPPGSRPPSGRPRASTMTPCLSAQWPLGPGRSRGKSSTGWPSTRWLRGGALCAETHAETD